MISADYYNRGYGNYVVASGDCICNFFGRFLKNYNDKNVFSNETLKNFLLNNVNRLLYSFGSGLSSKSHNVSSSRIEKITKVLKMMRECPFTNESVIVVDSGGFQVGCMGYVPASDIPKFVDIYMQFLKEKTDNFNMAFAMDIPVVRGGVFKNYNEVKDANRYSYRNMSLLPQNVKDKIYYIHHFITPKLYDIWSKFMWQDGFAEGFTNFSVGGVVSGATSDHKIKFISYCIPLSDIVRYCKIKGIKKFNFHLLGGASYNDIFYHQLFTKHIKVVHDIDVNITYDSSTLFKGIAVGRCTRAWKSDGNLHPLDLHSDILHNKYDCEKTRSECIYDFMNDISDHYNMKHLDPENFPIYDPATNTFHRAIHMFLMMHEMRNFREIEMMCQDHVDELYSLYKPTIKNTEFGDKFADTCLNFIKRFNGGKITDKMRNKYSGLTHSLNILTNCDPVYNKALVDKCMCNEDVAEMLDDTQCNI